MTLITTFVLLLAHGGGSSSALSVHGGDAVEELSTLNSSAVAAERGTIPLRFRSPTLMVVVSELTFTVVSELTRLQWSVS